MKKSGLQHIASSLHDPSCVVLDRTPVYHSGEESPEATLRYKDSFSSLMREASEGEGGTMKLVKLASKMVIAIFLILIGFATGFPIGRSTGFTTGSEWALVQADIAAREAGVFMPVYIKDEVLRIVIRQPRNLHKRARHRAEIHDDQSGTLYRFSTLKEKSSERLMTEKR